MNAVAQKLGVGTGETGESEELRRLKRENAKLKRAIEILKSAFFAAEIDRPRGRW
jgi:transposase